MEIKKTVILMPPLKRPRLQEPDDPIIPRTNAIAQPVLNPPPEATLPSFNSIMQPIDPATELNARLSRNLLSRPIAPNSVMQETNSGQQNRQETQEANQNLTLAPFNPAPDANLS